MKKVKVEDLHINDVILWKDKKFYLQRTQNTMCGMNYIFIEDGYSSTDWAEHGLTVVKERISKYTYIDSDDRFVHQTDNAFELVEKKTEYMSLNDLKLNDVIRIKNCNKVSSRKYLTFIKHELFAEGEEYYYFIDKQGQTYKLTEDECSSFVLIS